MRKSFIEKLHEYAKYKLQKKELVGSLYNS